VLAADGTNDGLFTVAEVLAGPRIDADLVVLLACQTGLGDLKGAEGTVGLQRAFLARGARAVLVSLWEVNEQASDALIRRFYEHWLDPARPVSRAQALRLAQRDVRDSLSREDPNPYYWAGFQLAGAR
jgi:CHAT domain-containing protein